jgi:hypothetical protein
MGYNSIEKAPAPVNNGYTNEWIKAVTHGNLQN